jgi:hypothetical protein
MSNVLKLVGYIENWNDVVRIDGTGGMNGWMDEWMSGLMICFLVRLCDSAN